MDFSTREVVAHVRSSWKVKRGRSKGQIELFKPPLWDFGLDLSKLYVPVYKKVRGVRVVFDRLIRR